MVVVLVVVETLVPDFFVAKAFFAPSPPPTSSGPTRAAALARVSRVVPLFSSFSLLMARCRIVRPYKAIVNTHA